MPSFISIQGKWKPAKERHVNPDTGEIYEGPDRAAQKMEETKGESLGMDVKMDPDNIYRARQLNMTIDEYLKLNDPVVQKKANDNLKENEEKVVTHSKPTRKPAVVTGNGGFGEAKI